MPPKSGLREHIRSQAENRPGIYRMLDTDREVVYVGKSVRVRQRLLSYFRARPGEKAAEVLRAASRIEWDYAPDEFGALVRERRIIQESKPRYNVEHKRRRAYLFVKVTREPAPRLLPVSRVSRDGAAYYGPFPRSGKLLEAVRELSLALGLRDCAGSTPIRFGDQTELFSSGSPPRCLRLETGSCLAPCAGECTEAEYRARVRIARSFLEGRTRRPLNRLREGMEEAARRMDFEYARLLRDRLGRLEELQEELLAFRGEVEDLSFVYRVPGFRGGDHIYLIQRGVVADTLLHPKDRSGRVRATRRIREVFGSGIPGPEELRPEEAGEILLVSRWFRSRPRERTRTVPPEEWLEKKGRIR